MSKCVTHHYACDCREEAIAKLVSAAKDVVQCGILQDELLARLVDALQYFDGNVAIDTGGVDKSLEFKMYKSRPAPSFIGVGHLDFSSSGELFFTEVGDKKVRHKLVNAVLFSASPHSMWVRGLEYVGESDSGSPIYTFQEWILTAK